MLIFVSGFLSVANVWKKMAGKKSVKGEEFYGLKLGYKCAKILSHKEKIYMPWTDKCQFLLVAL